MNVELSKKHDRSSLSSSSPTSFLLLPTECRNHWKYKNKTSWIFPRPSPTSSSLPTMVQNSQESRCKYWTTRLSVHSFTHTANSFACSSLLAFLVRCAALRCAHSLTHSLPSSCDSEWFDGYFFCVFFCSGPWYTHIGIAQKTGSLPSIFCRSPLFNQKIKKKDFDILSWCIQNLMTFKTRNRWHLSVRWVWVLSVFSPEPQIVFYLFFFVTWFIQIVQFDVSSKNISNSDCQDRRLFFLSAFLGPTPPLRFRTGWCSSI